MALSVPSLLLHSLAPYVIDEPIADLRARVRAVHLMVPALVACGDVDAHPVLLAQLDELVISLARGSGASVRAEVGALLRLCVEP